jgi:hypothetical protein
MELLLLVVVVGVVIILIVVVVAVFVVLYSSPNILRMIKSRRMRWAGHVERMGEKRIVYRVLVGKPERKRPLGRHGRRWEDNIKMDLQEVDVGVWIGSSWLRIGTGGGHLGMW